MFYDTKGVIHTTPETIDALTQAVIARLFLPIEASGRHVHVTRQQALTLFGHPLTPDRPLSQPGQYLSKERVTIQGPKGQFQNVAVLGPERKEAQIEISLTDGRTLGIKPPLRLSGSTEGTPGATLIGPHGQIDLSQGVLAAKRHIHLSPEEARRHGVTDGQVVSFQTFTQRPLVFRDVVIRVHPQFRGDLHIDYDEANACGFREGDLGRILP